jgi:hypothetical protein
MADHENPFLKKNPEEVLQERMKHARRITREEFIQNTAQSTPDKKLRNKK